MEAVSVRHRPIQIRQPVNLETDQDNNSFNSGDNNDTPQLSPTPTPVLDDHTSCFDPYYKKGDPNFTDGNEPFYQKLNGESIPFTGTGKKG